MSAPALDPTVPPTELLRTRKLCAGHGSVAAVRDLDIEVRQGEIVALLGSNGAGKTTTIMTIAGVLPPISGEVTLLGRPAKGSLTKRSRAGLGLITEERTIFRGLTVAENLRLGQGSAETALRLFPELKDHLPRKAGLLSGGQQQILALARALAADPTLLLADELSLGLAPLVVARLLREVRRVADESGVGVLLVEQHIRLALGTADRAYVLQRGRCVLQGSAAELRSQLGEIEQHYLAGGPTLD